MAKEISLTVPLAANRLLALLPTGRLRRIERRCRFRDYPAGARIVVQGEHSQEMYFLLAGRVHALYFAASGRVVAFASIEAGGHFGEFAAIDGKPRSATVVAATPCRVAVLPPSEFRQLIAASPDIAMSLLRHMAALVRNCDERIINFSMLKPSQRICLELLRLANSKSAQPGVWEVSPLPTQTVLAYNAGTTRETVGRVIHSLVVRGVMEKQGRSLRIRDRKKLETHALVEDVTA